jgi:hypothetical protein
MGYFQKQIITNYPTESGIRMKATWGPFQKFTRKQKFVIHAKEADLL